MPSPFETWTLDDAVRAIGVSYARALEANRLFVEGDHWQGGDGWTGPQPDASDPAYHETMLRIARVFVAENIIGEATARHVGGVVGREPAWSTALRRALAEDEEPNTEEAALIDEADALLTEWWDSREAHDLLRAVTTTLLWADRAVLRLYVPRGLVGEDGLLPRAPLTSSLGLVYLEAPPPSTCAVVTHAATQSRAGVFLYRDEATDAQRAELVYLADNGQTVLRILGPGARADGPNVVDEAVLSLGGRLTIFQMRRESFITDPVRRQQRSLNKAITMKDHNLDLAGFLERTFLNTELPFHYENDPTSPDGRKKVYDALQVGAGTTNVLRGITVTDANGSQQVLTPGVVYRDPVSVSTFTESAEESRRAILRQCYQLHVVLSGDAVASGESRRQAQADYVSSLRLTAPQVRAAGRWLLETTLALGATFAGAAGRYAPLRAVFDTRLDPGPLPAEEARLVMELVDKKLLSRQTGMSRVGVDDVDAEQAAIQTERAASLADRETRAGIVKALTDAGAGLGGAARTAGFEDEEVTTLLADQDSNPAVQRNRVEVERTRAVIEAERQAMMLGGDTALAARLAAAGNGGQDAGQGNE